LADVDHPEVSLAFARVATLLSAHIGCVLQAPILRVFPEPHAAPGWAILPHRAEPLTRRIGLAEGIQSAKIPTLEACDLAAVVQRLQRWFLRQASRV
jgi:hypothetical protein